MPYVIELRNDRLDLRMPSGCPYCMRHDADDSIETRYSKPLAIVPSPVVVMLSREARFRFPACRNCASQVRWLGKLAPPIAIVPAGLLVAAAMFHWPRPDLFLYVAIGCGLIAAGMLVARQLRIRRFRVGYQGGDITLLYAGSRAFAEEFAQLNHVPMRHRWFVFRLF